MPTAPAFPRCEITNVDDDCPVAGRAFAVSFHCFFPRFGRPLFDDFDPYLRGVKLTEALSAKGRIGCAECANFFKSIAMSIIRSRVSIALTTNLVGARSFASIDTRAANMLSVWVSLSPDAITPCPLVRRIVIAAAYRAPEW
jgi:hypothetical protein